MPHAAQALHLADEARHSTEVPENISLDALATSLAPMKVLRLAHETNIDMCIGAVSMAFCNAPVDIYTHVERLAKHCGMTLKASGVVHAEAADLACIEVDRVYVFARRATANAWVAR